MPFARPNLQTLIDRAVADIESRLPGADARLRRSNLNVLARTHAGAVHGLYGYLQWLADQVMYDTAESEYLDRAASIWLDVPRKAAVAANGVVTASGTNGVTVTEGAQLSRSDGAVFEVSADATIAGGTAVVQVVAVEAGAAGNTAAGSTLTFVSPIAGVQAQAAVDGGALAGGANQELDASLRARLLDRIRQTPHGGAAHDYVRWAKEVAGVTRAWVYPGELGDGTVVVRFVRDDDVDLIPDAAEVATVQAYIDALRPVTADVTVVAPVAVPLDLTIALTPNTAAVRAAVTAELDDMIHREAEPGATILRSHINEATSIASGETDHVLSVPVADVTHTTGQIATLGTITWL